jgi:hypothetical protein
VGAAGAGDAAGALSAGAASAGAGSEAAGDGVVVGAGAGTVVGPWVVGFFFAGGLAKEVTANESTSSANVFLITDLSVRTR